MHAEAREFVAQSVGKLSALEIGSLNVNGTIRDLFHGWDYTGVDLVEGPGVDVVANGATYMTVKRFDVVVCCEVFEHTDEWKAIVGNVHILLKPGGLFIGTAAGPRRPAHTCNGNAMPDPPTEYYRNIDPEELRYSLAEKGFEAVEIDVEKTDVRWRCLRGPR